MSITPIRNAWKGTMTPRERFNRQMHFLPVDRSVNMEFGYWEENYEQWNMFRDNGIKTEAQANQFFNFDPIAGIGGRVFMYPHFEEKEIGLTADGKRILQNSEGLIAEQPVDGHSTIPHYIKATVTPENWYEVKAQRFDVNHPGRIVDIAALKARHLPDEGRDYPLGVDCGSMIGRIRDMLTFEGLCYAYADEPEIVEDMVETSCQLVEHFLDQVLPHFKFDFASGWEDICFKNGPILPPSFFREVVQPRYRRIRDKLDQYGIDIWYTDCDGDVRPILQSFLDGGINCLFPYEVNSCAHPGELLDQYPHLHIMGGVDKMELAKGPEAIDAYLDTLVRLVARGGYIPFCDHRCPPNVKEEDYLYYLDRKEALFGMK
jgi:uroporphyrinogen decarboxylase